MNILPSPRSPLDKCARDEFMVYVNFTITIKRKKSKNSSLVQKLAKIARIYVVDDRPIDLHSGKSRSDI